jgi:hypothetical protein
VADSEEKNTTGEAQPETPAGPTAMIVRTNAGGLREVLKGPDGKFVKKQRGMPETREVTRLIRNILNAPVANEDGKIDRKGKKAITLMVENIIKIATYDGSDSKAMMAAVQAFEALMLRAHGKPKANEEEAEALQLSGVKYVVIQAPELPNPEVVDASKIKAPIQPSFLNDVEFLPPDRNKE